MSPARIFGNGPNKNGGLCECGCGQPTRLAPCGDRRRGWVKGKPTRFIRNHDKTYYALRNYRVEDPGFETLCWIWSGPYNKRGYGKAAQILAHQFFYIKHAGPVLGGMELHHRCEVKSCVNPDHLQPLTRRQHIRVGPRTKLEPWQVGEIRRAREECRLAYMQLAKAFGVSKGCINMILNRRNWRDLENPEWEWAS